MKTNLLDLSAALIRANRRQLVTKLCLLASARISFANVGLETCGIDATFFIFFGWRSIMFTFE